MDVGIYPIWPMVYLFGEPDRIAGGHILTHEIPGVGLTDLQGTVDFAYPAFNATVFYSKIADSCLPTELSGEGGNILLDQPAGGSLPPRCAFFRAWSGAFRDGCDGPGNLPS